MREMNRQGTGGEFLTPNSKLRSEKSAIVITNKVGKLIFIAKANSNPGLDAKIFGTFLKLYFFDTAG